MPLTIGLAGATGVFDGILTGITSHAVPKLPVLLTAMAENEWLPAFRHHRCREAPRTVLRYRGRTDETCAVVNVNRGAGISRTCDQGLRTVRRAALCCAANRCNDRFRRRLNLHFFMACVAERSTRPGTREIMTDSCGPGLVPQRTS